MINLTVIVFNDSDPQLLTIQVVTQEDKSLRQLGNFLYNQQKINFNEFLFTNLPISFIPEQLNSKRDSSYKNKSNKHSTNLISNLMHGKQDKNKYTSKIFNNSEMIENILSQLRHENSISQFINKREDKQQKKDHHHHHIFQRHMHNQKQKHSHESNNYLLMMYSAKDIDAIIRKSLPISSTKNNNRTSSQSLRFLQQSIDFEQIFNKQEHIAQQNRQRHEGHNEDDKNKLNAVRYLSLSEVRNSVYSNTNTNVGRNSKQKIGDIQGFVGKNNVKQIENNQHNSQQDLGNNGRSGTDRNRQCVIY